MLPSMQKAQVPNQVLCWTRPIAWPKPEGWALVSRSILRVKTRCCWTTSATADAFVLTVHPVITAVGGMPSNVIDR